MEVLDFINLRNQVLNKTDPRVKKPRVFKPKLVYENNRLKTIYINGSLIKKMTFKGEKRNYCPLKLYRVEIMRMYDDEPTIYQARGLYFESMGLGETAHGDAVTDLPRLRNGQKGIDQIRIDAQIENFKRLAVEHGTVIIPEGKNKNIQVKHKVVWDGGPEFSDIKVFITMAFDWVTPITVDNKDYHAAIVDLKLSGNMKTNFGEFCWSRPEDMDHISMFIYSFSTKLPVFYWVFDYSKHLLNQIYPINTNINHPDRQKQDEARLRLKEMDETIRKCIIDIQTYDQLGWHTEPSFENCKNCPILECPDRKRNQEI